MAQIVSMVQIEARLLPADRRLRHFASCTLGLSQAALKGEVPSSPVLLDSEFLLGTENWESAQTSEYGVASQMLREFLLV